mmetsp:Transcript_12678/g.13607  ORF Transcript_12678/g.13607 Transcript_12678/m.13607 type:complete len:96 (-) Transcript_12678:496-783(-)
MSKSSILYLTETISPALGEDLVSTRKRNVTHPVVTCLVVTACGEAYAKSITAVGLMVVLQFVHAFIILISQSPCRSTAIQPDPLRKSAMSRSRLF